MALLVKPSAKIALLSLAISIVSPAVHADCRADDAACLAAMAANSNDGNTGVTVALVGLAALGVYVVMKNRPKEEKQELVNSYLRGEGVPLWSTEGGANISAFSSSFQNGLKPNTSVFDKSQDLLGNQLPLNILEIKHSFAR